MGDKINNFFKKFNDNVQEKMDKILVDKTVFQSLTQQNEQLNQKITSQEDDFNLQYQTFQKEPQNLGKKICTLENEKQELLTSLTNLKHTLAAKDNCKTTENEQDEPNQNFSENSDKIQAMENEFDDELKRLKNENAEKSRNISKLMAERMKTEAEYCSKIERLNSTIQQKDNILSKHQNESDTIIEYKNRITDLLKNLDFEKQENSRITKELHSLTKTCEHRKNALDDLAVETQKEVKAKTDELNLEKKNSEKLQLIIDGLKNEDSNKDQALGLAQKQDWQKAREIDGLSQKVNSLERKIKGLEQQKNYLETVLKKTETEYKDLKESSDKSLEILNKEKNVIEESLKKDLEESMQHNKRLRDELEKLEASKVDKNVENSVMKTEETKKVDSRELKEAKSRAVTAEKKIQQLQRDMSKQLNLERKRSENLSKKLETMQMVNSKESQQHISSNLKKASSVSSKVSINSVISNKEQTEVESLKAEIASLKS